MILTLQRQRQNHVSTVGGLSGAGNGRCSTLEDAFRNPKVHGETRIPAGRYDLELRTEGGLHERYLKRFGPKFHKGMLWLQDVPDFSFVYIHIGNKVDETEGCILVGETVIAPDDPGSPFVLTGSERAYRMLYPTVAEAILRGDDVVIDVADPRDPLLS